MSSNPRVCAINQEVSEGVPTLLAESLNFLKNGPTAQDWCKKKKITMGKTGSLTKKKHINSSWLTGHAQMLMYLLISASNVLAANVTHSFSTALPMRVQKDKWLITGVFNAEARETPSFRRC